MKLSKGFNANLFASEPLLANPVAFGIDEQNRLFVCETFRLNQGVEDNRDHAEWIDDDLASKSVEDRLAFYKKHLGDDIERLTKHQDRIRLLIDRNEDGQADKAIVFADGFDGPLEGAGASVLIHQDTVYYACIPHLWALRDSDNDGKADKKTSLHEGYGVRVAFIGHDLHGLCIGPAGRLYFSIGDRGFNVKTKSGRLANPETGAVFRCEMDGSGLEVYASGLRNPQDLEFDDYGNLFTGDNNSDSGDLARWLHIVRDGDYGWRMAFQYMPNRGPWNKERMWEPRHAEQPAFMLPPVTNIGDGPSGIAYYPGTGMSNSYRGNFFLCDFRGEPGLSGVRTFKMRPNGASFDLIDPELFVWNCLPTDVKFGTDGAMYISDWVTGWAGTGKGRIFRVTHSKGIVSKGALEVKQILSRGLAKATDKQIARLLAHPDRRLRRQAQFELVRKLDVTTLAQVASSSKIQLARLHGVWGLGQIGRLATGKKRDLALDELLPLVNDIDDEVRFAATTMLADSKYKPGANRFIRGLGDRKPRVRFASAEALGQLEVGDALAALVEFIEENDDRDAYLRHAGAMAMSRCAKPRQLRELAKHQKAAVRLAALLALRRMKSPSTALFLADDDERIVTEAARAIHDVPIEDALPALAGMVTTDLTSEPLLQRVISANFRLGGNKRARGLSNFAADTTRPVHLRTSALNLLSNWTDPPKRDFVTGLWRPVSGKRSKADVVEAVRANLETLLDGDYELRTATAKLAADLEIEETAEYLVDAIEDADRSGQERAASLLALAQLDRDQSLQPRIEAAMEDDAEQMRAAGRMLLAQVDEVAAVEHLWQAIRNGTQLERQSAIEILAAGQSPAARKKMLAVMKALVEDQVPNTVRLDIYEAARQASGDSKSMADLLVKYENSWDADDKMAPYRDMLHGGNAERGERLFFENTALQCAKCHKLDGRGSEIGPDLSRIAVDRDREYLLASIVYPNRDIAEGYETLVLELDDGSIVSGILKKKTDKRLTLISADGEALIVDTETIEEESRGVSAMPDNLANQISPFQLRDLVEYLANLK